MIELTGVSSDSISLRSWGVNEKKAISELEIKPENPKKIKANNKATIAPIVGGKVSME